MQLKFIDSKTRLDIFASSDGSRAYEDKPIEGVFISSDNDFSCVVECDALFGRVRQPLNGDYLKFAIYRGADMYTFEGRISQIKDEYGQKKLHMMIISDVVKTSRRSAQRIQVSLPMMLHKFNKPIDTDTFRGTTFDISNTGLCVLSDEKLDIFEGPYFVAE